MKRLACRLIGHRWRVVWDGMGRQSDVMECATCHDIGYRLWDRT